MNKYSTKKRTFYNNEAFKIKKKVFIFQRCCYFKISFVPCNTTIVSGHIVHYVVNIPGMRQTNRLPFYHFVYISIYSIAVFGKPPVFIERQNCSLGIHGTCHEKNKKEKNIFQWHNFWVIRECFWINIPGT